MLLIESPFDSDLIFRINTYRYMLPPLLEQEISFLATLCDDLLDLETPLKVNIEFNKAATYLLFQSCDYESFEI